MILGKIKSQIELLEDSEECELLGYDMLLADIRDNNYEQSKHDINVGDEVEMPFHDLSQKYSNQSGHKVRPSSI